MHTIYFIPGMGADERLFSRLKLEGYEKRYIRWEVPFLKETLPGYARRLSAQIDSKHKFSLIGVSFGGLVAVEIFRFFLTHKTISKVNFLRNYSEQSYYIYFHFILEKY